MEVRLPLAEGPGFLDHAFVELEDEGTIAIGVAKGQGNPYAFARISAAQFWRMSRALFPEGDPGDDDQVRRGCD